MAVIIGKTKKVAFSHGSFVLKEEEIANTETQERSEPVSEAKVESPIKEKKRKTRKK